MTRVTLRLGEPNSTSSYIFQAESEVVQFLTDSLNIVLQAGAKNEVKEYGMEEWEPIWNEMKSMFDQARARYPHWTLCKVWIERKVGR